MQAANSPLPDEAEFKEVFQSTEDKLTSVVACLVSYLFFFHSLRTIAKYLKTSSCMSFGNFTVADHTVKIAMLVTFSTLTLWDVFSSPFYLHLLQSMMSKNLKLLLFLLSRLRTSSVQSCIFKYQK